jgi:RNA polymerase II elongation factor ELL
MPTASSSPMLKAPTSQPSGSHDVLLRALRVPLIHLLAVQPSRDTDLADTCRTSLTNVRELLPKIAKRPSDSENWQLTDKSFRELTPWKFTYKTAEDRERAIDSAIKAFDRLRLAKDDKLWQNLLPAEERGQGKCLSRLNVKAPEQKPATPLHKMPKLTDKKHAASKKGEEKSAEKGARKSKEPTEVKPKKVVKEDTPQRTVKVKSGGAAPATQKATPSTSISSTTSTSTSTSTSAIKPISTPKSTAPSHRHTPSADTMPPVIRQRKVMVPKTTTTSKPASTPSASATPKTASTPKGTSTPKGSQQPKPNPKPSSRGPPPQRDRVSRPAKPYSTLNTKPKNPSPLSASPPVNASDFEDTHPVHKALAAAPSPAKAMSGNSDHTLKRKANDTDSDIHNHNLSVKQARVNKTTPVHTPSSANGLGNGTTPASGNPLKRKSDDSSSSDTSATKVRKVANIDTGLASRYPNSDNQTSPDDTSSSSTSPAARLSFRQTVELSQRFQQCYKKYEELYWQLAEAKAPPTDAQRSELMKMHHTLEKMKREIRSGVGEGR